MERPSPPAAQAWSDDDELAGEIELYGDLVVAASSQEQPMTSLEIDNALLNEHVVSLLDAGIRAGFKDIAPTAMKKQ